MLRFVLLCAMVLQAAVAQARDQKSSPTDKVEVAPARLVVVKTEAELRQLCGVDRRIDACTRFVGYQLSTSCSGSEKGWSMTASARYIPFMILRRRSALIHEMIHASDVKNSVADFIVQLEETVFATQALCEDAAAQVVLGFPRQMDQFARASNEKYHPDLRKPSR